MRVALIGAPIEVGAGRRGAAMGPAALRIAGLAEGLRRLDIEVEDRGDLPAPPPADVPPHPRAREFPAVAAWARLLSRHTYAALRDGAVPIVLGGDHSLSMGTVNGAARRARELGRPLAVLWLDAHADFNTPHTSPSGNMHGMPMAVIAGEPGLEAVFGPEPHVPVPLDDLHLFGVRSIDRGERDLLRARGVDVVDMRQIDENGVSVLIRRVLDAAARRNALLHVSLDVDFLDPSLAPGVGTTVPGGATYREAHLVMELLHDSGLLASLDVVELNPFLDVRGQSAFLLVELLQSLFGQQVMDRTTLAGPR